MPVRTHNSSPLFPLAQDWFRAMTHVQSQGINRTKRVFKNQLCLVTGLRPEVIAHNLVCSCSLILCDNLQVTLSIIFL
jgi:hypothetical protein